MKTEFKHNGEKFVTTLFFGKNEGLPHVLDLIRYNSQGNEVRIPMRLHSVVPKIGRYEVTYLDPDNTPHVMNLTPCLVTS